MEEQTHLNGAYYGPPIPPRPHSYRRPGRGSSCCCGPCCLLSFLFKFIVSLVIIVWLALRPARVKVHVDTAELSQFNLTNGNVLHYNLSLSVSVRNPNKRIGICYDRLEARAFYQGQRLDSRLLPTFFQGHKNTTMLYPAFSGQQLLVLGPQDVNDFEQQNREGRFEVDVKIYARIRFKVGKLCWIITLIHEAQQKEASDLLCAGKDVDKNNALARMSAREVGKHNALAWKSANL